MNRIFRLVWNQRLAMCVPAPECGRGRGKASGVLRATGALVLSSLSLAAYALPTAGQVTAGQGNIVQGGSSITVTQQSANLAINWLGFGIGSAESVTFAQPGASAIALNRVLGSEVSQIHGRLSANGQVWLLNPNGVLFGGNAQVTVGGLVASTLNITDADFLAGRRTLIGTGGSITNQGRISAADGGFVALLGGKVSNDGVIQARLGTVALAGGNQVTLDFDGDKLLNVQVDRAAVDAVVHNRQLIQADGGTVLLSTRAASDLLKTAVNNTGVIEARTVESHNGSIRLLGSMAAGSVAVAGTLDASAPRGGDGGRVETGGANVKVDDGVRITTDAAAGKTGQWLLEQAGSVAITPGRGGISGSTLASQLATTNVSVLASGKDGGGELHLNDDIAWNSANGLTLSAAGDLKMVKTIRSNGTGDINLRADNAGSCVSGARSCATISFTPHASITASGGSVNIFSNPTGSSNPADANGHGPSYATPIDYSRWVNLRGGSALNSWMLVNDINQLQAIDTNLAGRYALGRDIDASATAGWNQIAGSARGFVPLGTSVYGENGEFTYRSFAGSFDGLGHTIGGLTIRGGMSSIVGYALFAENDGQIRNVRIADAYVTGSDGVGALVARNHGTVSNSSSSGFFNAFSYVGGLVAFNDGAVLDSASSATVIGFSQLGGLVGGNSGTVSNGHATGPITGTEGIGGLVGVNTARATVSDSSSSGRVSQTGGPPPWVEGIGGLVGLNQGQVRGSSSTGNVTGQNGVGGLVGKNSGSVQTGSSGGLTSGTGSSIGGLVGSNSGGTVNDSQSTGATGGFSNIGGLVGLNTNGGVVSDSRASGAVGGSSAIGGLVGGNEASTIADSYASGAVDGRGAVGGLVGADKGGTIVGSHATGHVSGASSIGGLVGYTRDGSRIATSYATGSVNGQSNVGGLVGSEVLGSSIENSYATGDVNGAPAGGLVGYAWNSSIAGSYATGRVSGSYLLGGLVGMSGGGNTVTSSYWDRTTSGQAASFGGTALTDAQMKQKASFAGFDFVNVWGIDEGVSYPFLLAH
jgi:filamentous hemagglutinin family protein